MPPRKRAAEDSVAADTGNSRRRSGRISSTPKTQKSSYWEGSDDEADDSEDEKPVTKKARVSNGRRASSSAKKAKTHDSDEDEYTAEAQLTNEAEEEDEDEEDEDDENRPMKVTIVPLEQMRGENGVPYEDHKVHKNTMLFLKDLKANNRRPWLKSHDGEYRRAFKDWQSFVDSASQTIATADATIPELPSKDVVFRIYRDTRFSKDPTPYKPHFSAAWSRTGRKGTLRLLLRPLRARRELVRRRRALAPRGGARAEDTPQHRPAPGAVAGGVFGSRFAKGVLPAGESERRPGCRVEGVCGQESDECAQEEANESERLMKLQKGYDATHRDIELLKLKNYTVGVPFDENVLCGDDAQQKMKEFFCGLEAFVTFLNSIVMPDPGLDESDSEDDEEEEEDDDED
ncbi:hypothetical protein NLG97_g10068 [Lecanicillium saksenae]|uniref:Uncharacterized protein n=1 Tax=Lecanicillium saksenae TaxID=468837 RepID=A0ACC1QFQ5_9HYPO|nr:hypothetical protein NLG97_g10068 [Lecanicillium saksenae]